MAIVALGGYLTNVPWNERAWRKPISLERASVLCDVCKVRRAALAKRVVPRVRLLDKLAAG